MNRFVILFLTLFMATGTYFAQETCEELPDHCLRYFKPQSDSDALYISDGQVYRAFLDDEQKAEFQVTFYGRSTYRIAATAGSDNDFVIFDIKDEKGNLLFTNEAYENAPYWDFEFENTMNCIIETRLDLDKKTSGCVVMLIGFQQ